MHNTLPFPDNTTQSERDYFSVKVYGKKAALSFEADQTAGGIFTVAIHAASMLASNRKNSANWSDKIIIQLTAAELPIVTSVFLGFSAHCKFSNHGKENNKGFSIENQGAHFFVKVFQPGSLKAVRVTPPDVFHVVTFCLRQLRKSKPWMSCTDIINTLRLTCRDQLPAK